jgi:hypothetical protein
VVVAILVTVSVAYLLTDGFNPCPIGAGTRPILVLTFGTPTASHTLGGRAWYENLTLQGPPPPGTCWPPSVSTNDVGFKIVSAANSPIAPGSATCSGGSELSDCSVPSPTGSWIAVLQRSAPQVTTAFPTTAGSTSWTDPTTLSGTSFTLTLLSGGNLSGSGDVLEVYGTGGSSVSGQVSL